MKNLQSRFRFFNEVRSATTVFSDADYSVITGGFAQGSSNRNDVDILTVIPCFNKKTIDSVVEFARAHVAAQLNAGYIPDWNFPTDVVTRQQIVDATSGRAFGINCHELYLKNYSEEEIVNNPEADYRIWLYEMITHDFDLITGSFNLLVEDTRRALETVFLYTAAKKEYSSGIELKRVRSEMFELAGLQYTLGEKQTRYLIDVLESSCIARLNGDEVLDINSVQLQSSRSKLEKRIVNEEIWKASHLYKWEQIRSAVNDLQIQL